MELSPDKIPEVFPEIKGKVEKFKGLFKVGDYTLQYSFFQKSADANHLFNNNTGGILKKYTYDPAYSVLSSNVYHYD